MLCLLEQLAATVIGRPMKFSPAQNGPSVPHARCDDRVDVCANFWSGRNWCWVARAAATSVVGLRVIAAVYVALTLSSLRAQSDGVQRWAFSTLSSSTAGKILSSPAVAGDGTIYVGVEVGLATSANPAGRLLAINQDGSLKWSFTTADWVDSAPAIGTDGTIYFGCWDGNIFALNPDGSQKWKYKAGFIMDSPAIGPDGTLYVGSGEGNLYALTPGGALKWSFPTADWIESSPAVAPDGTIYVGSLDGNLYAIKPDGTEKWHFGTGNGISSSPAIAADGTIYFGSRDLKFYALTPAGALKWSFTNTDVVDASPAIGDDGTIYFASTGGRVFALNRDGTEKWRYPQASQPALLALYSSPAVRADGTIVFGTSNNALYALKSDGTLRWQAALGDYADSSPLITSDGSIFIGCYDKKLYAFSGTTRASVTDWSQFRRDERRTGWEPLGGVTNTSGRLVNLSVRSYAGTGDDTLIVGFVVSGSGSRTVMTRGVGGTTLASYGVSGALPNPLIKLFSGQVMIDSNDNWSDATNAAQISSTAGAVGAFPLPSGSVDAVVLRSFNPGPYTVVQASGGGATGIALMEIYDADSSPTSRLVNVAARSQVGTGAGVLIAGFVIVDNSRTVMVRGIGPALASRGLSGALANPQLRLYRNGQVIAENDDWSSVSNPSAISAAAKSVGAFDLSTGSLDSVVYVTLPPGVYSGLVSGVNNTTGVGLIEVYEMP